jgi:precorrin-4/cobalt-precorrin-4 C11-methyltransferase
MENPARTDARRPIVYFVGGGPGAADLLTVRGARAIAAADMVVWGRNLVMEGAVTEHAREDAELLPWPPLTLDEMVAAYDRVRDERLVLARVHSGDPAIYGTLEEEMGWARERDIPYEVVPGISALSAATAALGRELTGKGSPRPVVIARRGGRVPPAGAEEGSSEAESALALFMSRRDPETLEAELLEAGYREATPCAVVHRVSWPDEEILRCPLAGLADRLSEREWGHLTLVLVGAWLRGQSAG